MRPGREDKVILRKNWESTEKYGQKYVTFLLCECTRRQFLRLKKIKPVKVKELDVAGGETSNKTTRDQHMGRKRDKGSLLLLLPWM